MADAGMDFDPGPLLKEKTSRHSPYYHRFLPETSRLEMEMKTKYMKRLTYIPTLDKIFTCTNQSYSLNSLKCLINNGLTRFGICTYSLNTKFIVTSVNNCRKPSIRQQCPELREMITILLDFGLQHAICPKHIHIDEDYDSDSERTLEEDEVINGMIGLVQEQARQPLSLQAISRVSIRRSLGGVHFNAKVQQLPLPQPMKSYIIGPKTDNRKRDDVM